ncbi:MAG: M20/M25/M40 family metallo-hydrolase, partial [Paracoccus sp. (in: a-proteobacteria)]|nr:M20/M25/M40 family metallo-hydrolase [Paracoccus sp. (in: a-proteobacteria)]
MVDSAKMQDILTQLDTGLDAALDRLLEFLRIPSISTDPAHKGDVRAAAEWLVAQLRDLGFEVTLHDTPGHPMVVAKSAKGDARPVLFYGHYDVQPVDPLELWTSPPFQPAIEDTADGPVIRGRGASDDKGQLMTFVEAFRAWKAVHGTLPTDLILLFEGEEESGSPSLRPFLDEHADELRASVGMICDTSRYSD